MQRLENITGQDPAGDILARYLHLRAGEFLRGLRLHREAGPDGHVADEAASALRATARRIGATLHTFRPLLDAAWADQLRTELAWLGVTLGGEHACAARLSRLIDALHRLSGGSGAPARGEAGALTVGAARAGALLDRQLTPARARAHSAALQALGSSRFHAVADAVALLASEVPLAPAAAARAEEVLIPSALAAQERLERAVAALPLARAARPYNAEALVQESEGQDSPWHQVRRLLRLHRYAQELLHAGAPDPGPGALALDGLAPVAAHLCDPYLCGPRRGTSLPRATGLDGPGLSDQLPCAARALDRHREAAEAAAAAQAAARTPRIAPATAYALGVLHADQRHEVEAARFAFQRIWQPGAVTTAPAATTAAP
ncbi:CHAD domain-containing protein [Streptomyces sp. NPDC006660]|uniref:CHAD domain-containing protein n=1 Tax=Streptomyces sp. NPDC006660 TaxID=3156901 RepID=UPI0033D40626